MSTLNLFSTGKHWLRLTSLIVLITLVIGQAQTQVAHAATLTVNQTGNQTDSLDADSICSLIDAIQVANGATDSDCGTGDAGSDVIVLGNATYTLTANYGNGTGLPIITSSISIEGNGATIERSSTGGTPQFRLFWVSTGGALSLNNVTLRNGYAIDFNSIGGGIFIDGNGTLTVNNSSLVNNYANGGGGIYDWSAGAVTINNTSFSANRGGDGGAIYNRSTELVISNSSFSGNEAGNRGGGIYNFGGTVTLSNNSFSGNSAPNGSGIYNFGTINNNGDLTNDDSITNERTMQNNGPIQNNGTIQNNDKIYNSCTGTISGNAVNGKTPLGTCVTTTTLTSSLNPSSFGDAVTFTVTVTSASGTPTGTVTFSIDGVSQAPVSLASGQASFTTSSLSVGAHTITASYGGDGTFPISASSPLTQQVVAVPAPAISVFQDSITPITNNTGTAVFIGTGSAPIVSSIQIRNVGTADLTLTEPIDLTGAGFTLVSSFGSTTVTPGSNTSFEVQCDAADEGTYTGSISFRTNDTNANPFTFALNCEVSAVPVTPTDTPITTPTETPPIATPTPVATVPPPPPTPLCEEHNFDEGGVVRASISDALGYAVNCRVLYQNGAPTQWLGGNLYNAGAIGIQGVLDLGVQQAVDIFSPVGRNYFEGGAVFCLRGSGTLIWLAAKNAPRVAEIIGSYEVDDFPGFTCATLFEPGTLVLVRDNPM